MVIKWFFAADFCQSLKVFRASHDIFGIFVHYKFITMKRIILTAVILFFIIIGFTQENPYDINYKVRTDQEAHYPDGDQKLVEHIFHYLNYSAEARKNKVQGQVTVSFKVQPNGSLTDVRVLKGVGYGIDEELVKILKDLKFAPSIQNGVKIATTLVMNFPVSAT